MTNNDRDKRLIELFLNYLNRFTSRKFVVSSLPDTAIRDRPAVDTIATDEESGDTVAVEHTLLQPFTGDRIDTVPFLKIAGHLDKRSDLSENGWTIDLIFDVGAFPKGVDWDRASQQLEEWFVAVRPSLTEGRSVVDVDGLDFPLKLTVEKSRVPGSAGNLFVMRKMPKETVDLVVRAALASKVPKLAATTCNQRILLLELESPARGNSEISQAIDDHRGSFAELSAISSIWTARTTGWETENFVWFSPVWPLSEIERHLDWRRLRNDENH